VNPCSAVILINKRLPDDGPMRLKLLATFTTENVILMTFLRILNVIVNDI
jgi:hypothetical protein